MLPCILDGLADEAEGVRDAALSAGRIAVELYANSALPLLLPAVRRGWGGGQGFCCFFGRVGGQGWGWGWGWEGGFICRCCCPGCAEGTSFKTARLLYTGLRAGRQGGAGQGGGCGRAGGVALAYMLWLSGF